MAKNAQDHSQPKEKTMKTNVHGLDLTRASASLEEVATVLLAGHSIATVLEPGDMTQYRILLAPMWNKDVRSAGTGVGDGSDYLYVGLVNFHVGAVLGRQATPSYIEARMLTGRSSDPHTASVLAAYLEALWEVLDEASAGEMSPRMLQGLQRLQWRLETGNRWRWSTWRKSPAPSEADGEEEVVGSDEVTP